MNYHNINQAAQSLNQPEDIAVCLVKGCTASTGLHIKRTTFKIDGTEKRYYVCRRHQSEYQRRYYATPSGKISVLRAQMKYAKRKLAELEAIS